MAHKATEQVRVNTTRYLDEDGLDELWEKIKQYVANNAVGGGIDLSDYATIEYVTNAISNIPSVDLTPYETKEELATTLLEYAKSNHTHSEYLTKHQDISNLATKDEIPSLDGYATESYVTKKIAEVSTGGTVDLSEYAKKTDIPDVSGFLTAVPEEYVTETELNAKGYLTEHQDLSSYALKTEIPDTSNFAEKKHTHTEYQVKGDYASTTHNHDEVYQPIGNYLTEHQSLEGYLKYEVVTTAPDTQEEGVLYIVTG